MLLVRVHHDHIAVGRDRDVSFQRTLRIPADDGGVHTSYGLPWFRVPPWQVNVVGASSAPAKPA